MTHWGPGTHICVSELGYDSFKAWHWIGKNYLNHWQLIVNWTLGNKRQWNCNQNTKFSFLKLSSEKCPPFCSGLNALIPVFQTVQCHTHTHMHTHTTNSQSFSTHQSHFWQLITHTAVPRCSFLNKEYIFRDHNHNQLPFCWVWYSFGPAGGWHFKRFMRHLLIMVTACPWPV